MQHVQGRLFGGPIERAPRGFAVDGNDVLQTFGKALDEAGEAGRKRFHRGGLKTEPTLGIQRAPVRNPISQPKKGICDSPTTLSDWPKTPRSHAAAP
jgi:hypothetical protein